MLTFPVDISTEILSYSTINDIWHLACTSKRAQEVAQIALRERFCRVVAPYARAGSFGTVLKDNEAVISGFVALQFAEGRSNWKPDKLEVYVPFSTFSTVVQYLVSAEGYKEYSVGVGENAGNGQGVAGLGAGHVEDDGSLDDEEKREGISQVVFLKKGDRRVDVTCSNTDAALYPISLLGCTAAVNYLGKDQFGCAYPAFTFRRQCLECCPGRRTPVLMTMHEKMGYEVCMSRYDLDNQQKRSVGRTMGRSFEDDDSFRIDFSGGEGDRVRGRGRVSAIWDVRWRMGGRVGVPVYMTISSTVSRAMGLIQTPYA